MGAPRRAIIYTRVSHDPDGRGRSVSEQERECRTDCQRQGWEVIEVLQDNDRGASRWSRKDRPAYHRLAELLRNGAADVLVTWEASRAHRDLAAYVQLRDLCAERGVLWSYSGRVYDLARADDRFSTGLDSLLSEKEAEQTRERVLRTVRANVVAGRPHGKIPYGYRREYDPLTREGRQIPDEETGPVVREIARRLLAGEALYGVAADLNARGVLTPRAEELKRLGKPVPPGLVWDPIQVRRMAISPTNAGLRSHNGVITGPATWPGLISEADYRLLVDKLTDPARRTWRDGSVKHLLVGIAECGVCGAPCRRVKNRGTPSYSCSGDFCVTRVQRHLDEFVTRVVVARLSQPDVFDLLTDVDDTEAAQAAEQARTLRARLNGFYDEAADGKLTPAGLARIEAKLLDEIKAAERRARPCGLPSVLVDVAGPEAQERWDALSVPQRREVLRVLLVPRIMPTGKGTRFFDPTRIEIVWRRQD